MSFIDKWIKSTNEKESCDDLDSRSYSTDISETDTEDVLNIDGYDDKIEEMHKMISEEWIAAMEKDASSGSKMIKVSDEVHDFRSQLESYIYRGEHFECFNPIECECIVDIQKSNHNDREDDL